MNKEIPLLTASDVELRIAQIQQTSYGTYATLLAYKNSRVDMKFLDEVFGPMNWCRSHCVIDGRLFCTVSIWDEDKQQWVSKQDVGVPSNTEATKGEASDAFKRACFNVGIGRELYSAPDIRIKLNDNEVIIGSNGKPKTYAKFFVAWGMTYDKEQGCFTNFTVLDKDGNVRFSLSHDDVTKNRKTDSSSTGTKNNNITADNKTINPPKETPYTNSNVCSECHSIIKSQKVLEYALNRYGKAICYECQKRMAA